MNGAKNKYLPAQSLDQHEKDNYGGGPDVDQEEEEKYEQFENKSVKQLYAGCRPMMSTLAPLAGIREQENEDISEITYRASAIYLKDEPQSQPHYADGD